MDEPHYWIDDLGQIIEYVPLAGPTALSAREVCRRLNNQKGSLKRIQEQMNSAVEILKG